MEQRKLVPMVIEETIKRGKRTLGNTPGTIVCITEDAKVIINEYGKVITVMAQ